MSLNNVRNYLAERQIRIVNEWKIFNQVNQDPEEALDKHHDPDLARTYKLVRNKFTESENRRYLQSIYDKERKEFKEEDAAKREPFEYYELSTIDDENTDYAPAHGIIQLPLRYHTGQITSTTETLPETGFALHPLIKRITKFQFPQYYHYLLKYCRPLGTTLATFQDFNRPQYYYKPVDPERRDEIISLVKFHLNAKPYRPLHYVDTLYMKTPLSTGTGYHNRHSYKARSHAKISHPPEYKDKPTSKGYFMNAYLEKARMVIHRIKETGYPSDFPTPLDTEEKMKEFKNTMNKFFNQYPTVMYTRNHISEREGKLKQRPVYAVDELFITIEGMLYFPLLTQARKLECCIMYGFETIRGGNVQLDKIAQLYQSYFTVDWSAFDQTVPRCITDTFFIDFLPSLIVTNQFYQPTYEYPIYVGLTEDDFYNRMHNLLRFLHIWYNNMTFITANGKGYRRTTAGIPSGMLGTQYIDSYANLFVIIDAMLEYGKTAEEIKKIRFFIMGDDNSGFTNWNLPDLENFVKFLETYAYNRYGMTMSAAKSIVTNNRQYIQTLSYQCNFGRPTRPLGKAIAQLSYPERGWKDKYMSYRAIGIAYSACAMDRTFHEFCEAIYEAFLEFAAPLNEYIQSKIMKDLPGPFRLYEELGINIDFSKFPTFEEIANVVSKWHGPLHYEPKWNYAHFIYSPDHVDDPITTLYDERIKRDERYESIELFSPGY